MYISPAILGEKHLYFEATVRETTWFAPKYETIRDKCFRLTDSYVQREIWGDRTAEGIYMHLTDIYQMTNSPGVGIKECAMQIESFKNDNIWDIEAENVLANIQGYSYLSSQLVRLLQLVSIGLFLTPSRCLSMKTKFIAQLMETVNRNYTLNDLPVSCKEYIPVACEQLCNILFKDKGCHGCLISAMSATYPFLDEKYFCERLEILSKKDYSKSYCGSKFCSSQCLVIGERILQRMASHATENETSKMLLERLLRCMSLKSLFVLDKQLCDVYKDRPAFLVGLFKKSISMTLKDESVIRSNSFTDYIQLLDMLKVEELCPEDRTMLAATFTCSIAKPNFAKQGSIVQLKKVCINYKLFRERKSQVELFVTLASSSNKDLQQLFLDLAVDASFLIDSKVIEEETYCKWMQTAIRCIPQGSSIDTSTKLSTVYHHASTLWKVPAVNKDTKLQQKIRKLLSVYIGEMDFKFVLQKSKMVGEKLKNNKLAEELFCSDIQSLLVCESRPEEALREMCSGDGRLWVNNR